LFFFFSGFLIDFLNTTERGDALQSSARGPP